MRNIRSVETVDIGSRRHITLLTFQGALHTQKKGPHFRDTRLTRMFPVDWNTQLCVLTLSFTSKDEGKNIRR